MSKTPWLDTRFSELEETLENFDGVLLLGKSSFQELQAMNSFLNKEADTLVKYNKELAKEPSVIHRVDQLLLGIFKVIQALDKAMMEKTCQFIRENGVGTGGYVQKDHAPLTAEGAANAISEAVNAFGVTIDSGN